MLTFVVIDKEQLSTKTVAEAEFLDFVEDTVGVYFGYRQFKDLVILENNLLEVLNPLATKLFGSKFFDTLVVINMQDEEYQSLSKEQIKVLHEKL